MLCAKELMSFEYSTVLYHNESYVVLEGVSNTYSIPLTVSTNMVTVPVDAGSVC